MVTSRALTPSRSAALAAVVACLWVFVSVFDSPGSVIWDDSFMFVRYADHLQQGLGVAWDPGQAPVWGPTSLGYLALVTWMRFLSFAPGAAVLASSFLAGGLFVALSIALTVRVTARSWGLRLLALALLLTILSRCGNSLGAHFRSGMDTTFAMAYLSAYLSVAQRLAYPPTAAGSSRLDAGLVAGLLGGAAFVVRPDLVVYASVIPLSLATSARLEVRRGALRAGLLTLVTGGALWAMCWRYFKTPVPLSFYVKSLGFDPAFTERYRALPAVHLSLYFEAVLPLLLVIVAGVFVRGAGRAAFQGRIEVGVGLATVAFVAFYRFDAVQVMHYSQRFYYPTLPALIYLALSSLPRLARSLERFRFGREESLHWLGAFALLLVGFIEIAPRLPSAVRASFGSPCTPSDLRSRMRKIWPGLDGASKLPNDLVIATSEVGIPGALNPGKTVVDTSGLNDRALALGQRTAAEAVLASNADLVYLHPDYVQTNTRLLAAPSFAASYVAHSPATHSSPLAVYLRKDGKYFAQLAQAIDAE